MARTGGLDVDRGISAALSGAVVVLALTCIDVDGQRLSDAIVRVRDLSERCAA